MATAARTATSLLTMTLLTTLLVATSQDPSSAPQPTPAPPPAPSAAAPAPPADPLQDGSVTGEALIALHRETGQAPDRALLVALRAARLAGSSDEALRADGERVLGLLIAEYADDPAWTSRSTARTFVRRLRDKPWIFRSYFQGATVENGYTAAADAELVVEETREEGEDRVRVVLRSAGADSARPIGMKRGEDGLWRLDRYSTLFVDIRPPRG